MTKWDEMIKRALYIYTHRDEYTYCLGASGQMVGSPTVNNLFSYYYKNGYAEKIGMDLETWNRTHAGKKAFDCSGFLDYCRNGKTGHDLTSHNYGIMEKYPDLVKGTAGACLWKYGHVGLDIGYGFYVHFPNWNRTCEFGKILESDFTESIKISDINYEGADAR